VEHHESLAACTRAILAKEGLRGLYKGMVPALLKAAPSTMITFFVYETSLEWLRR
jgi:solute carrier family 25 thiamine pyrophosphate transporter 19